VANMALVSAILQVIFFLVLIGGISLGSKQIHQANQCDKHANRLMKSNGICFVDDQKKLGSIKNYLNFLKAKKEGIMSKVFSGAVKFEENKVKASAALDPNQDGQPVVEIAAELDVKEGAAEIFKRSEGAGKVLDGSYEVSPDLQLTLQGKLDTDKDGEPLLLVTSKFYLPELPDEVIKAIAKKKNIALA
jgi:hypothetical protein